MSDDLLPYQQRVVDEKQELDTKIGALSVFIAGVAFSTIPSDEQDRLTAQYLIMMAYSTILASRIKGFTQ